MKRMNRTWATVAAATAAFLITLSGCQGVASQKDAESTSTNEADSGKSLGERVSDAISLKRDVTIPTGTVLTVQFDKTLSSAESQPGERFTARVVDSVEVDGKVAIAAGSTVTGTVVTARPAKRLGGASQLDLAFTSLELPSGVESPLQASFPGTGKRQTAKDAGTIGGATAGGAILGRIIGHDRDNEAGGTAIGAAVGAAVGTGIAASNRGQDVTLPEGLTIEIQLDAPVTIAT